jgi:hypothetical protein
MGVFDTLKELAGPPTADQSPVFKNKPITKSQAKAVGSAAAKLTSKAPGAAGRPSRGRTVRPGPKRSAPSRGRKRA